MQIIERTAFGLSFKTWSRRSLLRKRSDMKKPIQRVKIMKAIARRTKIRDQKSSFGYSEVFKNWMKRSGSRKFILLEHKIIDFFMNSYWSKDLREAHHKSQWNGRIDDISGFYIRHHCQDTGIAKWKELYEWFKRFQDAESILYGNSHVTSRPVSFTPHPIPEWMLRHFS